MIRVLAGAINILFPKNTEAKSSNFRLQDVWKRWGKCKGENEIWQKTAFVFVDLVALVPTQSVGTAI
jgi:hypothetical protein